MSDGVGAAGTNSRHELIVAGGAYNDDTGGFMLSCSCGWGWEPPYVDGRDDVAPLADLVAAADEHRGGPKPGSMKA